HLRNKALLKAEYPAVCIQYEPFLTSLNHSDSLTFLSGRGFYSNTDTFFRPLPGKNRSGRPHELLIPPAQTAIRTRTHSPVGIGTAF
ncbi:hypothetical protein, partial [Acetobacter malorum]|uniref:hypothetical protein n=1 Tax=Acetobacter malorum TaxID=178901 RepID=UPI001E55BA1C